MTASSQIEFEKEFSEKMKEHQQKSRASSAKKFHGGLADHQEKTIMGHTATHLLHQALRIRGMLDVDQPRMIFPPNSGPPEKSVSSGRRRIMSITKLLADRGELPCLLIR